MEKLSAQNWSDANKKGSDTDLLTRNIKQIMPVKTNLVAVLGSTEISIRELLDIGVGDVVRLDALDKDDITLLVGLQKKYMAQPGCLGNQKAVKITRVIG
jgi:flagellar motor switch protein FliM